MDGVKSLFWCILFVFSYFLFDNMLEKGYKSKVNILKGGVRYGFSTFFELVDCCKYVFTCSR